MQMFVALKSHGIYAHYNPFSGFLKDGAKTKQDRSGPAKRQENVLWSLGDTPYCIPLGILAVWRVNLHVLALGGKMLGKFRVNAQKHAVLSRSETADSPNKFFVMSCNLQPEVSFENKFAKFYEIPFKGLTGKNYMLWLAVSP